MTRRLCWTALALCLFTGAILPRDADAQRIVIGRGGAAYNGYGQGYYGGYGQGYNSGYVQGYYGGNVPANTGLFPGNYGYSGYGNGPYGYGAGSSRVFPARGGIYGNGFPQPYVRIYSPYGYATPNPLHW